MRTNYQIRDHLLISTGLKERNKKARLSRRLVLIFIEKSQGPSSSVECLDSPVPILETVLLVERAKLIGKPVFLVTDSAISFVQRKHPKN